MTSQTRRWARTLVLLALVGGLAACGLPRSGPNKREIFSSSVEKQGNAFIVPVNDSVARLTATTPQLAFTQEFLNAGLVGADTIRPGDVLELGVWENVDNGLLSSKENHETLLKEMQVGDDGYIFVPYAGRVLAAGNSPEALRRIITNKLDPQTPDPQVTVSRKAGDGATVTVIGAAGQQGVFPIERPSRTLSAMIAMAGGVTVKPEVAQIIVTRHGRTGTIWLKDLYDNPRMDIALRGGDVILVEADQRAFTAMGATGAQTRVTFESQTLSAIEALARVGGLTTSVADPTGVFVFRDETEQTARAVLNRPDLVGTQRIAYVLNLTEPNGMFDARDFMIRDGDTLYVTEAPYMQWYKTIAALTGSLNSANTLATAAGQ